MGISTVYVTFLLNHCTWGVAEKIDHLSVYVSIEKLNSAYTEDWELHGILDLRWI